jgi:hypothetical protein
MGKKSTKSPGAERAPAKKTAAKKRTAKPSASAGRAEAAATAPAAEPDAPRAERGSYRARRDAYEAFRAEAKARAEARRASGEPPSGPPAPKKVTRLDPDTLGFLVAALRKRGKTLAQSAEEAARQGGAMLPYAAEQWTRASECEVIAAEFNRIDDELLAAAGLDYFMYFEMG